MTAADVKRVANKYLGKARVVLSIVPIGQAGSGVERRREHRRSPIRYTEKTAEIKP